MNFPRALRAIFGLDSGRPQVVDAAPESDARLAVAVPPVAECGTSDNTAAIEAAYARGLEAGRQDERDRVVAIVDAPRALELAGVVFVTLRTGLPADKALGCLDACAPAVPQFSSDGGRFGVAPPTGGFLQ